MTYENLRYANPEHSTILTTKNGEQLQVPVAPGNKEYDEIVSQGLAVAAYVDSRTLQQIYDEEVLASLDRQVLKDAARMVEDFYDALVDQLPQSMKDKHGPLMAERKTKRAARP
jgi:hypothetical protein